MPPPPEEPDSQWPLDEPEPPLPLKEPDKLAGVRNWRFGVSDKITSKHGDSRSF